MGGGTTSITKKQRSSLSQILKMMGKRTSLPKAREKHASCIIETRALLVNFSAQGNLDDTLEESAWLDLSSYCTSSVATYTI